MVTDAQTEGGAGGTRLEHAAAGGGVAGGKRAARPSLLIGSRYPSMVRGAGFCCCLLLPPAAVVGSAGPMDGEGKGGGVLSL